MNKTKVNKILSLIVKTCILVLSFAYIYYKICYHQDIENIENFILIASNEPNFVEYISVVILLIPINWGLETIKWRFLIEKIEKVSFYDALKAVLVGITFSSFTPNRIGDYFGRAFMLKKSKKSDGVLITIIGSIAQTVITIVIGTLGFIWLKNIFSSAPLNLNYNSFFVFLILFVLLSTLSVIIYFKIAWTTIFLKKIKFLKNKAAYIQIVAKYSFKELLIVLTLSLLRYIVFAFQFYLLLKLFNINIPIIDELAVISVIYLISTIVPTIALTELGIKSASAIFIFELYFSYTYQFSSKIGIGIVSATFLLWILNLVIPALFGSLYVFKMKLFKSAINE